MIRTLIRSDLLKMKRKGLWFLALLGPFGVVAIQMVNYGYRKEYLMQQSEDDWAYYLSYVDTFTALALVLGITILTSFIASIENETNAWKQLMALPVSRMSVYLSKFTVIVLLLMLSSTALMGFATAYGIVLDMDGQIPLWQLFENSFYPSLAALPILAFQLWLALISKNQAVPITIGILGTISTDFTKILPDWFIWKWPTLTNDWNEPIMNVALGIGIGIIVYVAGMLDYTRRDVK